MPTHQMLQMKQHLLERIKELESQLIGTQVPDQDAEELFAVLLESVAAIDTELEEHRTLI